MIFPGITFNYIRSLGQHTDFLECPSMLSISLGYYRRVLLTRPFFLPFNMIASTFLAKMRTLNALSGYPDI